MKNRKTCNTLLELTNFSWHPTNKNRLKGSCKKCVKAYQKNYHKIYKQIKNPIKKRNYNLKHKFGITLEQYNNLFNGQNGCCAICKEHQTNLKKSLSVDHCHVTNQIRGLLCQPCNIAIGHFKDNINNCLAAANYLNNVKTLKIVKG